MCTSLGVDLKDYCVDPKWLIGKVVARKGYNEGLDALICRISIVSHHLQSLMGAIELANYVH